MRLVQDLLLVACLLFLFQGSTATDLSSPLQRLWSRIQTTLDSVQRPYI